MEIQALSKMGAIFPGDGIVAVTVPVEFGGYKLEAWGLKEVGF